jgi:SP family sugar:H+ symporter-like MFS transporter
MSSKVATEPFFSHPKTWALWTDMTARGWRISLYASFGAMIFGYDTAWWGGVLGMPAFTSRFGVYNPKTMKYAISAPLASSGEAYCPFILGLSNH